MKNHHIILASASPRRKDLLHAMGLEFEIIIPDIDECPGQKESPPEYVMRNAREKVKRIKEVLEGKSATHFPLANILIIAADTIVVRNKMILEKPASRHDAISMLESLSGRKHSVFTGFSLMKRDNDKQKIQTCTQVVKSSVWLKKMAKNEIISYVETGEPMDKAGSYAIQGLGASLVRKIEGSYTNVVGLPIFELCSSLRRLGIQLF